MRRALSIAAIAVCLGAVTVPFTRSAMAQERAETVFRDARAYTVRIRTQITDSFMDDQRGSFSGAGFFVDAERGWVVTNAHVVGQCPSVVTVAFADGHFVPARKIYVDSFTDVAVIEVSAGQRRHPVAPLDCERVPQVGEAIGAFGHPLGMPYTGTRGIVSGKTDQWLADLLQMDATVDHGNSGGPVIALRDGRIVGIATAGAGGSKADRCNFATPMKDVCKILALLEKGIPPDPPQMEFSLLVDEDGSHTLSVGRTYDATRWPFVPGDHILTVGEDAAPVRTMSDLVTALRGVQEAVPVRVTRDGKTVEIKVKPARRPSVVDRRGIIVDGAVIAPIAFEDLSAVNEPAQLVVHSVEPGSPAEALGLGRMDIIYSVDGHAFDLGALTTYMEHRRQGVPVRIVFRRFSDSVNRWFEFHARDLPGEQVRLIGAESRLLSGAP